MSWIEEYSIIEEVWKLIVYIYRYIIVNFKWNRRKIYRFLRDNNIISVNKHTEQTYSYGEGFRRDLHEICDNRAQLGQGEEDNQRQALAQQQRVIYQSEQQRAILTQQLGLMSSPLFVTGTCTKTSTTFNII